MITHEYLKEILHYEESTGHFYWKKRLSMRVSIGALAGHVSKVSGYVELRIHGKMYRGHELAWFYKTGEFIKRIDHRNNIRHDNSWDNLRLSTQAENNRNKSMHSNNTSGYKGVSWNTRRKKYVAGITFEGKYIYIGQFDNAQDAAIAYDEMAITLFGEFSRTNKSMGLLE